MKDMHPWMLCGFLGLIGVGCGGTDIDPAGGESQRLIKVTSATLARDGKSEITTVYAPTTTIDALKQRRRDAARQADEGLPLEEALAPDLGVGNCNSIESLWVFDEHGADLNAGNLCCLVGLPPDGAQWDSIANVCAFPLMLSLWSGSISGYYESTTRDCRANYSKYTQLPVLGCPDTDFVLMDYPSP
jgi:hypothetical protein